MKEGKRPKKKGGSSQGKEGREIGRKGKGKGKRKERKKPK